MTSKRRKYNKKYLSREDRTKLATEIIKLILRRSKNRLGLMGKFFTMWAICYRYVSEPDFRILTEVVLMKFSDEKLSVNEPKILWGRSAKGTKHLIKSIKTMGKYVNFPLNISKLAQSVGLDRRVASESVNRLVKLGLLKKIKSDREIKVDISDYFEKIIREGVL
jgi:predicted transcriptional regulator